LNLGLKRVTTQSNKTLDQIVHPLRGTPDCTHNWFCDNTQSPTANPLRSEASSM